MEKAKELLRTTGYTVNEIAEQVGYNSSQYFAVCLKNIRAFLPESTGIRYKNIRQPCLPIRKALLFLPNTSLLLPLFCANQLYTI